MIVMDRDGPRFDGYYVRVEINAKRDALLVGTTQGGKPAMLSRYGHAASSPPLLTAMHSNNMSTTFATQAVAFVHSTNWNREKKFMEKNLPLREAVQQLLNRRGETKYGLAKAMGVNPQSFDTTLKRNVTITTFVRIAEGLGITPGQLMDEVMKLRP